MPTGGAGAALSGSPRAPRTPSFATNDVHAYPEPARTRSRLAEGRGRSPACLSAADSASADRQRPRGTQGAPPRAAPAPPVGIHEDMAIFHRKSSLAVQTMSQLPSAAPPGPRAPPHSPPTTSMHTRSRPAYAVASSEGAGAPQRASRQLTRPVLTASGREGVRGAPPRAAPAPQLTF